MNNNNDVLIQVLTSIKGVIAGVKGEPSEEESAVYELQAKTVQRSLFPDSSDPLGLHALLKTKSLDKFPDLANDVIMSKRMADQALNNGTLNVAVSPPTLAAPDFERTLMGVAISAMEETLTGRTPSSYKNRVPLPPPAIIAPPEDPIFKGLEMELHAGKQAAMKLVEHFTRELEKMKADKEKNKTGGRNEVEMTNSTRPLVKILTAVATEILGTGDGAEVEVTAEVATSPAVISPPKNDYEASHDIPTAASPPSPGTHLPRPLQSEILGTGDGAEVEVTSKVATPPAAVSHSKNDSDAAASPPPPASHRPRPLQSSVQENEMPLRNPVEERSKVAMENAEVDTPDDALSAPRALSMEPSENIQELDIVDLPPSDVLAAHQEPEVDQVTASVIADMLNDIEAKEKEDIDDLVRQRQEDEDKENAVQMEAQGLHGGPKPAKKTSRMEREIKHKDDDIRIHDFARDMRTVKGETAYVNRAATWAVRTGENSRFFQNLLKAPLLRNARKQIFAKAAEKTFEEVFEPYRVIYERERKQKELLKQKRKELEAAEAHESEPAAKKTKN